MRNFPPRLAGFDAPNTVGFDSPGWIDPSITRHDFPLQYEASATKSKYHTSKGECCEFGIYVFGKRNSFHLNRVLLAQTDYQSE